MPSNKLNALYGTLTVAVLGAAVLAGATLAVANENAHWGYSYDNGPSKWAKMSEKFRTCGAGKHQSPINIEGKTGSDSIDVAFSYKAGPATVTNNGHTIQVNVAKGNSVKIDGKPYDLVQFHFHTPSENTFNGLYFPMETHLVHKNAKGELAVVAVMIKVGSSSIIDTLPAPTKAGRTVKASEEVNPAAILPADQKHYAFTGSLTTPPCSEGVTWVVMQEPIHASNETIARMHAILGGNNRPTNPLNGRKISSSN